MATAVARDRRAPAPSIPPNVDSATTEVNFLPELRKCMMLLATLTASVTYSAVNPPGATLTASVTYSAVNPPGGFSSDNDGARLAGDPVLQVTHPRRYLMFFYCNAAAFVASLVVIMLLMSKTVTRHGFRSCALWVCAGAAMVGLMGAFASGSCRSVKTSIYVVALVAAVLFYIGIQVLVFLCKPVGNLIHDVQETLERYLKFQSIASGLGNGNGDAYQILKELCMNLLLLGIFAASATYQAGLNPPGGFWQSDAALAAHLHYLAGDPVVAIGPSGEPVLPIRYRVFICCNPAAFIASLVSLILLLSNVSQVIQCRALQVAMILNLLPMIGAYAAGSSRQVSKSDPSLVTSLVILIVLLSEIQHLLRGVVGHEEDEEEEEVAIGECMETGEEALLLLLAILAAVLTYHDGMSPPCDNLAFFYYNATAFFTSLAIIMLLVNRKLSARGVRCYALWVCVTVDVIGLMGAFAAGGYRKTSMVDVLVLVFAVLACIAFQVALSISETVRRLLSKFGADPLVEEEGSEDELEFGVAGGTNEEPLGMEISSPILGGALTLILAVPVMAILETPVKLLVAMMIATIVVGIWRRLFAPSVKALARALQRRCIPNQGTSASSNPREHLVSALCHGLCKLIHTLCSGAWMWIIIVVMWVPSLKPNIKLKFKISRISAVLGVLAVSTTAATTTDIPTTATATATGASTTTATAMDTPSTATSTVTATRTTGTTTSGSSMRRRRRDQPPVEPRPMRNRRPNSRLMGGEWVN